MKVKKIGIVSLSRGILGEDFIKHELEIGIQRLTNYGIEIEILPHALKGLKFIEDNPNCRAKDLISAFEDDSIDMILCAIGGEDTYRLLPYLFDNDELKNVASQKIFLGFSDTTINHLMLNKIGINTFYGQAFLPDICELSNEMLPYTKNYFEELITTGRIKEIRPSDVWYKEREDFSKDSIGMNMESFPNKGFELIKGKSKFEGKILGGCIETIFNIFENYRFEDTVSICRKYDIFPSLEQWKDKILLLETSENKPSPAFYKKMIGALNEYGIFGVISGLIVGKPQDEIYYEDYKEILLEELSNYDLSIVYNINTGHATPRCIVPFGVRATVDTDEQVIKFYYE